MKITRHIPDSIDWFMCEVEQGLAEIERSETLSHEDVGARLEKRLAERRPRP